MLRPSLQFASSRFDSKLKTINNNLSGRGSLSLSFSDKGEFAFDELRADGWETRGRRAWTQIQPDNFPLNWYKKNPDRKRAFWLYFCGDSVVRAKAQDA